MNGIPFVSVVMSVYNGAATLAATMDSVLSQEGVDFEFIVINDGSTDGSGAMLDDYARRDDRVRVIHQDNTGLTRALIRGCAEARGKYIARQDAGDLSLPSRLSQQIVALEKSPECIFVSCWTEVIGPEDELLYLSKGTGKAITPIDILSTNERWGVVDGPSHHGSVIFQKKAYFIAGGYRQVFYYGQDWDLWYRLATVGKFIMIQKAYYQARLMINSISGLNRETQERFANLSHKAMLLSQQRLSDAEILKEASEIKPINGKEISKRRKAATYYFIGECLRNMNNNKSIKYFLKSVFIYPYFLKSWIRLIQSRMSYERGMNLKAYKKFLRHYIRKICMSTIHFRGKGRIVLQLDRWLTDQADPDSYLVYDLINNTAKVLFDLRAWGQKFAFYYGRWECELLLISRKLYRGGVFVDVGSSIGLYVVCMADIVLKMNGKIISIEPIPFNLERQKKCVSMNGFDGLVSYLDIALGERNSTIELRADPLMADNNALVAKDGEWKIEMRTLDSVVENFGYDKIGFLKMDVEGYEPMVLKGSKMVIAKDRPIILSEFNRERMIINNFSMEDSWNFLMGINYVAFVERNAKLHQINQPGEWENIFFIPKEHLPELIVSLVEK